MEEDFKKLLSPDFDFEAFQNFIYFYLYKF